MGAAASRQALVPAMELDHCKARGHFLQVGRHLKPKRKRSRCLSEVAQACGDAVVAESHGTWGDVEPLRAQCPTA